jgi:cytoskeletal protein RodZ
VARLNSVRITVIGLIIVVALALGAWTRLTIAMASGAAASRVSAGSPTTSALAMTNVATSKGTKPAKTDARKSAKTDAKSTAKSTAKTTAKRTKSTTSASTTKAASATPTASSTATSSRTATSSTATSDSSPQQIAQSMLSGYGWDGGQWTYLYQLWEKESGWSVTATNPGSGAYGIAQANPASQMDSVGSDWQTDATTQIKWGLEYIKDRYGSPAAAWAHETADGWY